MSNADTCGFRSPESHQHHLSFTNSQPAPAPLHHEPSSTTFSGGGVISTGITDLDAALRPSSGTFSGSPLATRWAQRYGAPPSSSAPGRDVQLENNPIVAPAPSCAGSGGIQRGEITEVTGPRGVGKTAFAVCVAARALLAGEKVMWIDTAGPICRSRVIEAVRSRMDEEGTSSTPEGEPSSSNRGRGCEDALKTLLHFQAPSVAHLMALVCKPPPGFPPADTGLVVIDNISSLFSTEFKPILPSTIQRRQQQPHPPPPLTSAERQDKLRWKLVGSLATSLRKLALRLDSAVLAINEMGSRFRAGRTPTLQRALSGWTWDMAVSTQVVLYFEWVPLGMREQQMGSVRWVRIAEVVKTGGVVHAVRVRGRIVPFVLQKGGITKFPNMDIQIRLSSNGEMETETETEERRLGKRKSEAHETERPVYRKVMSPSPPAPGAAEATKGVESEYEDEDEDKGASGEEEEQDRPEFQRASLSLA